ncbi:phage tail sheath subtilisin-like domain-containing protein [Klebsiella michiganensis]|uniref:phage tail sheath subtilisin-like domain-containing protein n=1 Tax=Klebsiella/Raoultella group TaxID=2890311 RepID=UPI0005CA70BA|nr:MULTISPECIES: phage tail sheath subtilisin-like domain-containing protein [Klebsiella/Raoultella group]HBV4240738.1 phage tail protein [Klebsiella pneumoniae]KIZ44248.1 tail sheath protein [Raoultella ornithinolytica]MCZ0886371.1 phage tail sheath subtilisin-like domain-containing protein [Raoultella ornithinolytica]MDH1969294.1 phage tail sheath subtilisin-like domain-containing protein [Klebsiella michiganensis]MEA5434537.1 phage tail sheath subtilisin-like domain-containing protein [Kleb
MSLGNIPDDFRVPLVIIDIDNSQALDSAPAQSRKIIAIGQQSVTGTATALTSNRITSDGTADQLYGKGSMLAGMLKTLRKANSYTEVWAMGLSDIAAGAAAKSELTVTGPATTAGTLALLVNGVSVQVGVGADDTADTIATAIITAVNKLPDTQVIAALKAASTTSVTLTTNWKGVTGNAMDVRLNYYTGEQTPAGVAVAMTAFTGGTGTPDIAAVVAALGDDWYTDIVFPYNDTQSLNAIRDELLERWGPLQMIEAQLWTAFRGTHAESGTFGETRNDWLISCLGTNIAPQPHWLWAASYGGIAAYYLANDPARPLQTLVLPGILPPAKDVRWDMPERNLLLHDGIATHNVDAGGNVCIEREITMYRVNQYGDADTSYLNVQSPATLGRIRYVIKNRFSNRYPRHKLAGDDVLDLLDPGQPVMAPKIARAELLDIALTELIPAGLVEDFDDYKDTLDVYLDGADKDRLNFICHPNLVNQLRVLAGLIQFKL